MQDLSLHLLDIAENSVRAGARCVQITLNEMPKEDLLMMVVQDDGKGMNAQMLQEVVSPFFTTRSTRRIGLGIPLLKQNCEQSGGKLLITSEEGKGTFLQATMQYSHLDRLPIGDINSTLVTLIEANPQIDWVYTRWLEEQFFELDTREIKAILQDIPLHHPETIAWLKTYLVNQNERIYDE